MMFIFSFDFWIRIVLEIDWFLSARRGNKDNLYLKTHTRTRTRTLNVCYTIVRVCWLPWITVACCLYYTALHRENNLFQSRELLEASPPQPLRSPTNTTMIVFLFIFLFLHFLRETKCTSKLSRTDGRTVIVFSDTHHTRVTDNINKTRFAQAFIRTML